jgi:hypothetical protein
MTVVVNDVRKVVVIGWDLDIVKGTNASIQANEVEKLNVVNDGAANIYFPLDYTGQVEVVVRGSKSGEDSGTIEVTAEHAENPDVPIDVPPDPPVEIGPPIDGEHPPVNPPDQGGSDVDGNTAKYVFFNDGSDPNVYAIVTQDNGDGTQNLFTLPAQGQGQPVNGIPQREPNEYGPEGGGNTWHTDRTEG